MKWVAVTNFIDSQWSEATSVVEVVHSSDRNKLEMLISERTKVFRGSLYSSEVTREVSRALKNIFESKDNNLVVGINGLDTRLAYLERRESVINELLKKCKAPKQVSRQFDCTAKYWYTWEDETSDVRSIIADLDFQQNDIDGHNVSKIGLFWELFCSQIYHPRGQFIGRVNPKFLSVKTPINSFLWKILTTWWDITDSFWKWFCRKYSRWNMCIKPIGWKPNLPFWDVVAALLADEDDKKTWAPPTIVWANKSS